MWFTLAIFGLSVIFAGVALVRLRYVDPFDPQRLDYIRFMLGSMLGVAVAFFVAAMSFSFQPLRIQRIRDQGNRTSIFLANQEFRRIVYERSVAQRMRDESGGQ
ncbi:hypothetical protein LOC68_17805 [Blastopirellula sp. JC732]|uniref:Uncharacterized protein n=1 Tax=Blastopirellula sediminis TaxID=2894196 RepID=A0A9X1SHB8_9BACT|nr:hypothetical protein [Blastopirellula sediminis]MCC9606449.1 hypothetical protein [Blastopirellula sediminis]MCC9630253.1 hypothetical protein [Blastopirellula sediminis]